MAFLDDAYQTLEPGDLKGGLALVRKYLDDEEPPAAEELYALRRLMPSPYGARAEQMVNDWLEAHGYEPLDTADPLM